MSERIERITRELNAARAYLNHVLDNVGDRWESPVQAVEGGWTARQMLIHLADADRGTNNQVFGIAEGREVIPADFDLDRYNNRTVQKRAEKTVEEARAELAANRAALHDWLSTVDEAKLDNIGRHATMRIISVEKILAIMVAHERGHADDIAGALGIPVS